MGNNLSFEVKSGNVHMNSRPDFAGIKLSSGTPVEPESLPFVRRHADRLQVPDKLAKDATFRIDLSELLAGGKVELTTWPRSDNGGGDDLAVGHELVYGTDHPNLFNAFDVTLEKSDSEYKLVVKHKPLDAHHFTAKSQVTLKVFVPGRQVGEKVANGQHGSLYISSRLADVVQDCCTLPSLECFNGTVSVSTISAEQRIGGIYGARNISLDSANGGITAQTLVASEHVSAKTENGAIKIDEIRDVGDVNLRTTAGELRCNEISATGRVALQSTAGSVKLNKLTGATEAHFTTQAGLVCVGSVTARDSLSISSTMGGLTAKDLLKAASITLKSEAGTINTPMGSSACADRGVIFSDSLSSTTTLGTQSVPWVALVDNEKAMSTPGPAKVSFRCTTGTVKVDDFQVATSRPFDLSLETTMGTNSLRLADPCPSFAFDLRSVMGQATVSTGRPWTTFKKSNTQVSGQVGDNAGGSNITSSSTMGTVKLAF
ncbi:hypothetical protein RI367_007064 [Sorochytrium milnesiophthora]